ncbi:hypothetical protein HWV62_19727 [Athelia sp. TMB]|nr:hypothetical protein HWV62_19727 [Athelia sp. TMB]
MADSLRRDKNKSLNALAELKRARQGGKRKLYDTTEDSNIYDEVTEDQYKSIVKGRQQRDDFVVDDGVDGYMDNGMDDFGEDEAESEEEELQKSKKKKGKKKATETSRGKPKAPPPPLPVASINDYRPVVSGEQEADFMDSILAGMDDIPTIPTHQKKSRKRKPSPEYLDSDPPSPRRGRYSSYRNATHSASSDFEGASSDGVIDDVGPSTHGNDDFFSPKKKVKTENYAITPAIDKMGRLDVDSGPEDYDVPYDNSFDDVDMNAFMDVDDIDVKPKKEPFGGLAKKSLKPATNGTAKKEDTGDPSWLSVYDSLSVVKDGDSLGPLGAGSASVSSSKISALEPDGSLRFFWLDYLENDGKIHFIGKLKDKTSGVWVSCCVTVENLQRNLFVLPREKRVEQDEDGSFYETDEVPELTDVYNDFDHVRKKMGIKAWKSKFVNRKYAFGEADVPKEAKWMKVVYGFNEPVLPSDVSSPNFARIFGTNATAFELLVLKRKIMGPCWLQIKNPQIDNKGISWCKLEATVSDPKDINPFLETDQNAPKEVPPLTIMIQIEDTTPPDKLPCSVHTFVRPLDRFPTNFEMHAKKNSKGIISPMANERMLLNNLLITIYKADPDVIVGHEFLGVSLDVLLYRMKELKAEHWSRIGRFRRAKWPNIGKQGSNLKFLNGRMLCDLASDGAKGMIQSTTWSLTEMCKTHLNSERQDIDPDDTADYFDGSVTSPGKLMTFVRHCELDAHYQMAIAGKVQMLPLTKQLTNLAGNSWNKTLNGGRAERNEYILLHEFHRLKYICPDKTWGKKAAAAVKMEADDDDPEAKKTTKGKRDKYKGGLVFEPKRGLWDKLILVMDFNSLYPSIIQEYNIDFTTVESKIVDEDGEEKIPEPPSSDVPQGVLPRLIATLVNRRRQVKSLMKDKSTTPERMVQYDIKQMALKLTANSMYGCLGFEYSRFYARPLAALTTYKGREILTNTKELAESMSLDVVYGDTDSVFVNSNAETLEEAMKISREFGQAVNDRYKLLEIDLDGVFRRLLLLQKKKYAAIKVVNATTDTTEVKGLDMKRREYCQMSKNASQFVLEQILSGEATEDVVEHIHEYLGTIGGNVREGKVRMDEFIVFKRLGKNPEDYPDAKSQPHVQVALRMKARGATPRGGDVIPYVFCLAEGEQTAKSAQADRAKHPDEIRKADSGLKIDHEYYLAHQVLPPIERLCEPIEGTDRARLAECLGLDPARFRSNSSGELEARAFETLDSQMTDAQRFKDAAPFTVRCRKCKGEVDFEPIYKLKESIVTHQGVKCPSPDCQAKFGVASLQAQLEVQIRDKIAKYYQGWMVCNDTTCGNRTRMMGVYGRRCLRAGCRGIVTFEYSDTELYNQLRYYASLFDGEKAMKATTGTSDAVAVQTVVYAQAALLQTLSYTVEGYMEQCGRRWVELSNVFAFMRM